MPLKIGSLRGERRPLTVPFADDEVKLWYWPAVYTADFEDEVLTLLQSERNAGALATSLLELIDEWDVLEDDGVTPYELSEEHLRTVPATFTMALFTAINKDAAKNNPNPLGLNRRQQRLATRNGRG